MPLPPVGRTVLHIGTEKTGSTSIQAHLAANRDALLERGILVPRTGSVDGGAWHMGIAAAFCDFSRLRDLGLRFGLTEPSDQRRFREDLLDELMTEIDAAGPHTVVLSSEHLHSRISTSDSTDRLATWFRGISTIVDVAVYMTRQDRLAVSFASTALRGGEQDLDVIFPENIANDEWFWPYYDYGELWARYRDAFGPSSIRLRTLGAAEGSVTDTVADFFELLGVGIDGFERLEPQNTGVKVSAVGLQAFDTIVRRFGRVAGDFAGWNLLEQLRDIAPGAGIREVVRAADAKRFVAGFEPGNRRIARDLGLPTSLFDTDFSEYEPTEFPGPDDPHDVVLEALGRIGVESAAYRRWDQIRRDLDGVRPGTMRLAPPAVLRSDQDTAVGPGQLDDFAVFDRTWGSNEDGAWIDTPSEAGSQLWMVVANADHPRPATIGLDASNSAPVSLQLTCRRSTATAEGLTAVLQIPSGISVLRIRVRDGNADAGAHFVLRGLTLSWN